MMNHIDSGDSLLTGRFFCKAGPVKKEKHYCIEPLSRIDLDEMRSLIHQEKYFILHAPRQTGKTSYMLALMEYLNRESKYICLYTNFENAQASRENVPAAIRTILSGMAADANYYLSDSFIEEKWEQIFSKSGEFAALEHTLMKWCEHSEKPVVLFIDEVDSLVGDTLISVLRQLRSGYPKRPRLFPQSIVLCGVRDIRDYRMYSDEKKSMITGGSAFNIKDKSLRMGCFTREEIKTLYEQHTEETGQRFDAGVFPLVWELTEGQPWLVNALGYELCFEMKEGRDRSLPITAPLVEQAKENLILRRETHLDQLADKLKEERVLGVLEPILSGSVEGKKIPDDHIDYVMDLGLIKREGGLKIANRIYKEVIPRQLTYSAQLTINEESSWYTAEDGRLDMDKLLTSFQDFFRKHSGHWLKNLNYLEAGPQLLLQAFLQRIVNSGGRIEREYGLGRERTDLLVIWNYPGGVQEVVIELKIRYGKLETTIQKGLEQTRGYMDTCGTTEGYLLVFDTSSKAPWVKKIFKKTGSVAGQEIKIFGM